MTKSLDTKIARILADPSVGDFILADAKDADMAYGLASAGKSPEQHGAEGRFRTLQEYRDLIRANVRQGLVDIMLMSVSTSEILTIDERLFDTSHITPAIRANDTTDIWLASGSRYRQQPAMPFRTATIDHAMCGKVACGPVERKRGADLGLFSMTFNNDLDRDYAMLEAYKAFRIEAESKGFRHFLEVFDPNLCGENCPPDLGRFIADNITRALAGVTKSGRPVFLKIPYHGPASMEAIASYDRSIVPGILGGAAGTTFDAFFQLSEAKKYGARAALYGRMINQAEHQPTFIQHLRWIADGQTTDAKEAVKSYHGALAKLGIKPARELAKDLESTLRGTAYGSGGGAKVSGAGAKPQALTETKVSGVSGKVVAGDVEPDFSKMSSAEKVKWNLARWNKRIG